MSKPPVCLGDLRWVVTFKERSNAVDSFGQKGAEDVFTTVLVSRASVDEHSGREQTQGDRIQGPARATVKLRYNALLVPPDGLALTMEFRGREFNIRHVKNWGQKNQWHILTVEEGVAQ